MAENSWSAALAVADMLVALALVQQRV